MIAGRHRDDTGLSESSTMSQQDRIDNLIEKMMQWVDGRMGHQNSHIHLGAEVVAVMDAQEVVKLSAAIQALAAVEHKHASHGA